MSDRYNFSSIPKTTIGAGVIDCIKHVTLGLGTRFLVVVDHHVDSGLRERIAAAFARDALGDVDDVIPADNLLGKGTGLADDLPHADFDEAAVACHFWQLPYKVCTRADAEEVGIAIRESGCDVVMAVGGSKCMDLVRAGLHFCGSYDRPKLVLVPTAVASNACTNGVSIMCDDDGQIVGFWNLAMPPEAVVVDSQLIADAPAHLLAEGIGDQVSSSLEALHVIERLGISETIDPLCIDHHRDVLDVLRDHAVGAVRSAERHEVTRELTWVLHALCRYTGPELAVATSFFSHVLDEALLSIPEVAAHAHGEIVGFGVLPEMVFCGTPDEMWPWVNVFTRIGIPCTLAELGIPDATRQDILEACEGSRGKIMASSSLIPLDPADMADAVMEADALVRDARRKDA
jgi:glycerol dehydrogenase